MHTHIRMHAHTCIHTCTHTCTHMDIHMLSHTLMHTHIQMYTICIHTLTQTHYAYTFSVMTVSDHGDQLDLYGYVCICTVFVKVNEGLRIKRECSVESVHCTALLPLL